MKYITLMMCVVMLSSCALTKTPRGEINTRPPIDKEQYDRGLYD